MSLIATLMGIVLGMICFSAWTKYMNDSVNKQTEKLDENNLDVYKRQVSILLLKSVNIGISPGTGTASPVKSIFLSIHK